MVLVFYSNGHGMGGAARTIDMSRSSAGRLNRPYSKVSSITLSHRSFPFECTMAVNHGHNYKLGLNKNGFVPGHCYRISWFCSQNLETKWFSRSLWKNKQRSYS
uniref:Uncharacterized protein n=1 Tax=Spongospora subterranea TaxID=70186 RepID=A0A0H5QQT3_9EUKA|eukprot:CRZ04445.1 hypothetical protein [Spongospora subterranea]